MKTKRIDSPKHRRWIASLPCLITGYQGERGVPHHLLRVDSVKGTGYKNCDRFCVPLESSIHDALHRNGDEVVFFANHGFDYETIKEIARGLCKRSPCKKINNLIKE